MATATLFWLTSGTILLMTILGGCNTFIGPVVGVAVFPFTPRINQLDHGTLAVGGRDSIHSADFDLPEGIVGTIKSKYLSRKTVAREVEETE